MAQITFYDDGQKRFLLPQRPGDRPRTSETLPHVQLTQLSPPEITGKLIDECLALPNVGFQQSRVARPGTFALALREARAGACQDALIDDLEFCHIHPAPEGFLHLTMPDSHRERVIAQGWGELHLSARAAMIPRTLILLYAPRDDAEVTIAVALVKVSCRFAEGQT